MLCTPNNHKVWIAYGSNMFIMNHKSQCVNYGHGWCLETNFSNNGEGHSLSSACPPCQVSQSTSCPSPELESSHNVSIHSTFHWIECFQGSNRNIQFGTAQRSTDFLFNIFNILYIQWLQCFLKYLKSFPLNLTLKFHTSCGLQNSWLHPGPGYVIQTTFCQVDVSMIGVKPPGSTTEPLNAGSMISTTTSKHIVSIKQTPIFPWSFSTAGMPYDLPFAPQEPQSLEPLFSSYHPKFR